MWKLSLKKGDWFIGDRVDEPNKLNKPDKLKNPIN